MDMMALGAAPRASATAAATAQTPKSSAAGMDTVGMSPSAPASAARSVAVMAPRASISATSCGHHSDTSQTTPG
eukprot:2491754-Pleurochrysis_carterae.AAC.1